MAKFMGKDRLIGITCMIISGTIANQAQDVGVFDRSKLRAAKPLHIKVVFIIAVTVFQDIIGNLALPVYAQHTAGIAHALCKRLIGKDDFQHLSRLGHSLRTYCFRAQHTYATV